MLTFTICAKIHTKRKKKFLLKHKNKLSFNLAENDNSIGLGMLLRLTCY